MVPVLALTLIISLPTVRLLLFSTLWRNVRIFRKGVLQFPGTGGLLILRRFRVPSAAVFPDFRALGTDADDCC